jgi:hypothetical protein
MHSINHAGFAFTDGPLVTDGLRLDNLEDGFRPRANTDGWVLKNAWLTNIHDDCVENDHVQQGTVEDSLFDGCYVGFSERPSAGTSINGSSKTLTINNSVIRFQDWAVGRSGASNAHNNWFKEGGSPLKKVLNNNVFMADVPGEYGWSQMNISSSSCSNNTMVWLGSGHYQASLPSCFTVLEKDTYDAQHGAGALRQFWDSKVAGWKARHGVAVSSSNTSALTRSALADIQQQIQFLIEQIRLLGR